MDLFVGSNFVVRDLRPQIDRIRGDGYPYGWRGKGLAWSRAPRTIRGVEYHQTAGSLNPGEAGPITTARFVTANPWFRCPTCGRTWEGTVMYPYEACSSCKDDEGQPVLGKDLGRGRGWPKMCYHLFVPWAPLLDDAHRFIVYQCLDWYERSWHSNAEGNTYNVAVAFQGLYRSRHNPHFVPWPETDGQPSVAQQAIARPLWYEYLRIELKLAAAGLRGHFQYGKPTCPGDMLESIVVEVSGAKVETLTLPEIAPSAFPTWESRQRFLLSLGFDLGSYGPAKDGVDGKPGIRTRAAIEVIQRMHAIQVTGNWDPETDRVASVLQPLPGEIKQYVSSALPPSPVKASDELEEPAVSGSKPFGGRRRHRR